MGVKSAVLAVALLVAATAGVGTAAGATGATRPVIVAFTATPSGANVVLTARVRGAATCTFSGAGRTRTTKCTSGRATAKLPGPTTAGVTYTLVVRGTGGTARRTATVAAPAPAATLSLSQPTLTYSGGIVTLTYASTHATTCTLQADPALWNGSNPARVSCNGSYDANIGTGVAARSWTFTFTAANGAGKSASATATLTQEAPPVATATLTASVTTVHSTGGTVHLTFSSANAVTCSLTSDSYSVLSLTTVACNGTYDATIPAYSLGRHVTFTFTAANGAGQTASSQQSVVQPGSSTNWSGYILFSSSTITSVSGTWTVPRLNCAHTPNAGAGEWVGIGGAGDGSDLLQTGTVTDCEGGVQVNTAWWELIEPLPAIDFAMTISPGDTIKASVFQWSDGSRWQTEVDDLTTGVAGVMVTGEGYGIGSVGGSTFTITSTRYAYLTYPGAKSAEWIVEAFTDASTNTLHPFADFGTVTFTNMTASIPLSLTFEDAVELISGGSVLSAPSALSGTSFSVAYTG